MQKTKKRFTNKEGKLEFLNLINHINSNFVIIDCNKNSLRIVCMECGDEFNVSTVDFFKKRVACSCFESEIDLIENTIDELFALEITKNDPNEKEYLDIDEDYEEILRCECVNRKFHYDPNYDEEINFIKRNLIKKLKGIKVAY